MCVSVSAAHASVMRVCDRSACACVFTFVCVRAHELCICTVIVSLCASICGVLACFSICDMIECMLYVVYA